MIKIKGITNEGEIHHFKLGIDYSTHNELISFFDGFGFSGEELLKIDTPFPELSGVYIYLKGPFKVHLFFAEKEAHMVIDSEMTQEEIVGAMKNFFVFP